MSVQFLLGFVRYMYMRQIRAIQKQLESVSLMKLEKSKVMFLHLSSFAIVEDCVLFLLICRNCLWA